MNQTPSTTDPARDLTEAEAEARSEARAHAREDRKQQPTPTEKSLTRSERNDVAKHGRLSSLTVYSVVLREGEEELDRPKTSLWWSGIAAGIGISTSVLAEGIIRATIGSDHQYLSAFESIGYTLGFVLVILSRLQLFTENTITVVLPLLASPSRYRLQCTIRLWTIVFIANMVGTAFTAAIAVHGGILKPEVMTAIFEISHHLAELDPLETFLRGVPAGFFIAALVWMLPSAKGNELLLIMLFTWLIAAGEFTHVIAGSNEIFNLVMVGDLHLVTAFSHHILPMLAGNVLGGTGLFAVLAYGQIRDEI